jgi:phosphate:Na+ symporter
MAFPLTIMNLAGTVALLLWGVRMVQTGIQRAFGPRLRVVLAAALRNRFRGFLAGIGVTAVLQSSTATGLMVAGFAASGLVELVPALAVMLGANVGTTLIVQLLSFDVSALAPALILLGVIMFRRADATRMRDLGRVAIGLGLMLMSLHQLLELITPYEDVPSLRLLLGAISTQPVIDVLIAAILTWAAHSSVAVVLLVMSFATKGVVPPDAAFALVLGANLGTAINPILEGASGDDPVARRLPMGNMVNRSAGCLLGLAALPYIGPWIVTWQPDLARAVADFHTVFNLLLAVLFFPFLHPLASLLRRWLPARDLLADPALPIYLHGGAREAPAVAVGTAVREALRLADMLESMLRGAREALERDDRRRIGETRRLYDVIDKLNAAIKSYLTSLDPEAMTDADHQRVTQILAFTTNMESAGDVVDKNLMTLASRRLKQGLAFSREGAGELARMMDRLIDNLRAAAALFMTSDERAARLLASEKETFRDMETEATRTHFERLRAGRLETAETGALHLDVLRDLSRINSHLVAAAAYPVLEAQGKLLPSRLRMED